MLALFHDYERPTLPLQDDHSEAGIPEALASISVDDGASALLESVCPNLAALIDQNTASQPSKNSKNPTGQFASDGVPATDIHSSTTVNCDAVSTAFTPPTPKQTKQETLRARNRCYQQASRQRVKVRYLFYKYLCLTRADIIGPRQIINRFSKK